MIITNSFHNICKVCLIIFILHFYAGKITEGINCKPFTTKEAKFAVENFYKIPLNDAELSSAKNFNGKISVAEIVENFVNNLKKLIDISKNREIPRNTMLKNGRKIVTIATDLCNKMPKKEANGLSMVTGFVSCVEFLIYQHMQRIVWRLIHKWGINWRKSVPLERTNFAKCDSLLDIYTEKKANAWQKLMFIYRNEAHEFLEGQSERIRHKFGFCLIIDGQMHLECEPIKRNDALFLVKHFHKIPIYEPNFEKNKGQMVEDMAINLFNSLKLEHRKNEEEKVAKNIFENEKKIAKIKRWRRAEKSMKVRLKVLVKAAGEKCQKMRKKMGKFLNVIGTKIGKMFGKNAKNAIEGEENEKSKSIREEFVGCIYHYMYSFSLNLIERVEKTNANANNCGAYADDEVEKSEEKCQNGKRSGNGTKKKMENLRKIYNTLREKMWQKMKEIYAKDNLDKMSKWLKSGQNEDEDDPFKKCANVSEMDEDEALSSTFGADETYGKSFDQHLMQCIGPLLDAVANDQFKYHIFVNFYTKQLESEIEFPDQMAQQKITQFSKDKCHFMREVLASLNKSITNRLNFEKVTKRSEKEEWVELHEKLEDLLMRREDKSWTDRMRRKLHQNSENLRLSFQKWTAMANPIKHPIRDEYRKMRELIRGKVIRWNYPKEGGKSDRKQTKKGEGKREKRDTTQQMEGQPSTEKEEDEQGEEDNENSEENSTIKQKIEQKLIKTADKILAHPLSKRFEEYEKFYKSFNIALALELFDRYEKGGSINLEFIFGKDNGEREEQLVSISDTLNYQKIKSPKNLQIFDEIAKRMGKKLAKGDLKYLLKKKSRDLNGNCDIREEAQKGAVDKKEERLEVIKEEEGEEKEENSWEEGEMRGKREKERKGKEAKEEENSWKEKEMKGKREKERKGKEEKEEENSWEEKEMKGKREKEKERKGKEEKKEKEIWEEEEENAKEAEHQKQEEERRKAAADDGRLEVDTYVGDEQQTEEDQSIGIGFELAHLGYLHERDGGELLDAFMEEMKLNMDQFGMSWDSDCDMSDDLNQCLMAADGLDFEEQLFRFSLLGKQRDQMGTLERAVESMFNKLNRMSYKFGRKSKSRKSFLARFYYLNIYGITEGLARLMSGQISPFEVFIPFYMRMKKGANFVEKKVMATSMGQAFRAWMFKLFNSVNATLEGREMDIQKETEKGGVKLNKKQEIEIEIEQTDNIEKAEIPKNVPKIVSENGKLNERLNPLLNNIAEQAQRDVPENEMAKQIPSNLKRRAAEVQQDSPRNEGTPNSVSYFQLPKISKKFSSNFKPRDVLPKEITGGQKMNQLSTISGKFSSNFERREADKHQNVPGTKEKSNSVSPFQLPIISTKFSSNFKPSDVRQRNESESHGVAKSDSKNKIPKSSGKFFSNFKWRGKRAAILKNESQKLSKSKLFKKFGNAAQKIKDLFIEFILKNFEENAKENDKKKGISSIDKRSRKKRETFEMGAAITAHIRQGKMGSSTVRSIMFNSRVIDTSIPGLHLHWMHANAAVLLGKFSLIGHLPSALLFSFVIGSLLFWWHTVKLAVYMAMLYGDMAGWAILLIGAAFYIIFCIFVL